MTSLDPDEPLPIWMHKPGEERDPERIDVLIEQLRSLWKQYTTQRLGQLLVNLADPKPNPLFYAEDHVLSLGICLVRDTGIWPTQEQQGPAD